MIIATQELVNMKKQINYNIVADINNLERLKNDLSQIKKNTPIKSKRKAASKRLLNDK